MAKEIGSTAHKKFKQFEWTKFKCHPVGARIKLLFYYIFPLGLSTDHIEKEFDLKKRSETLNYRSDAHKSKVRESQKYIFYIVLIIVVGLIKGVIM